MTPMPHPNVMTIQPEFSAFDLLSRTAATTPSPNRIRGAVHGLLRTLQHVGFVEQDEETGKYQLGAALLHMGSSYLDGNELRTRALNWSDSLAARTHESVRIGTL